MLSRTLHTRSWKIAYIRIRERFAVGKPKNSHPRNAQQFVGLVFPERHIIFGHAGHHAAAASRTFVQINDHPKSMDFVLFHQNLYGLTVIDCIDEVKNF